MADVSFPKRKKLYFSRDTRELSYVDDIWFDDKIWLSEEVTSKMGKPEVVLSRSGRHFKNRYDVISSPRVERFGWYWYSDAEWHADYCDMVEIAIGREIQYGGRLFSKTGSSYISAVNWDTSTKFGLQIDFGFWKCVTSLDTKPEVVLSCRGCHCENW